MSEFWQEDQNKDYIEGEYQVIEERDVNEYYTEPQYQRPEQPIRLDSRQPYITYIILGANIIVYLLMKLTGFLFNLSKGEQLLLLGVKYNLLIAYGQYWRLFTAMFLHLDIFHLFFNCYALYIYGPIVERLFGKVKFAAVYIASGLMGSLFSYVFSPNPAAGASGAIFGLMGALLYFRQRRKDIFKRVFGTQLIFIIAFNLIYGLTSSSIDNWGHIGGLIGGFLFANAIGLFREPVLDKRKILIWVLVVLIFGLGLWYGGEKYTLDVKPSLPKTQGTIYKDVNYDTCIIKMQYRMESLLWIRFQ